MKTLALLLALTLIPATLTATDEFWFGVEGPDRLVGEPGETVRAEYFLTLRHEGRGARGGLAHADCSQGILAHGGAYLWNVMVSADVPRIGRVRPGRIVSITTQDTDAELCDDEAMTQLNILEEGQAGDCRGRQAAWSQVSLGGLDFEWDGETEWYPFRLRRNHTSTIARIEVEYTIPEDGGVGAIQFIEACRGRAYRNALRLTDDEILYPELEPMAIELVPQQDPVFRRGDANVDGSLDITDGIAILSNKFFGTVDLPCLDAADTDDNGFVQLTDAVRIFGFLFFGNPPPSAPGHESCGSDPTDDGIDCGHYDVCP